MGRGNHEEENRAERKMTGVNREEKGREGEEEKRGEEKRREEKR
jgi:hypothetical protein